MSIDRETFDRASEGELGDLSTAEQVLGFLGVHADRAFKAAEIAARTELSDGAVSTALTRLKERGLVEHKEPYWAITTNEDRLRSHDGYARATILFNDHFGEEDREEWKQHAAEEPHPDVVDDGDRT